MSDAIVMQLLQRSIDQGDLILKELADAKETLKNHMSEEESLIQGLVAAFPKKTDGKPDFDGHASFHNTLIDESRARASFFRELQHELIKKGLWGLILIIGALAAFWWNGNVSKP